MSPWYFIGVFLNPGGNTPINTPVLVPFPSAAPCTEFLLDRQTAWIHYAERNRRTLAVGEHFASWISNPDNGSIAFKLTAGPIVVRGSCVPAHDLSLDEVRALNSSPP